MSTAAGEKSHAHANGKTEPHRGQIRTQTDANANTDSDANADSTQDVGHPG